MNCDEALRILTEPKHQLHQEAVDFVAQEPSCFGRVDQLARAILSDLDEETTCAEVQTQLPHYYELEQARQEQAAKFPTIHAHLARCPYCQDDYQILQDAMFALDEINANVDSIATEKFTPVFDLSFLSSDSPASPSSVSDKIWQLQDGVHRLFDDIRVSISDTSALIATMGSQLTTGAQIQPSVVMRGGEDDVQHSVLILPDASAHICFRLDTIPSRNGTAQIVVQIFEPEQKNAIQNVRVTLRRANKELVAGSLTDVKGTVEFSMLSADGYSIEAKYDGKTWELPIIISQE